MKLRARSQLWAAIAAVLLVVLGGDIGQPLAQTSSRRSATELMDAVMWNREPIGGAFQLADQTGQPRTERDFYGKLLLVYFGFTYCPDVCPTDLMAIGQTMDALGALADRVQPLFITLDPARDTPEHLADYVKSFHPRLIGLTGSMAAIDRAAEAYRVYFAKVESAKDPADYTVDHSAFIYLMDQQGKYLGFFPPGTNADRMAETIRRHIQSEASK